MYNRKIIQKISQSLKEFPAIGLIGPRQCGKTTLAKNLQKKISKKSIYLDLELSSDRNKLKNPEFFFRSFEDRLVILDEVQTVPEIFGLLRALIDEKRRPGRFLLLGSSNLSSLSNIQESLAGRIQYLEMTPLQVQELPKRMDLNFQWLRGGYPLAVKAKTHNQAFRWLEALIESYLDKDLPRTGVSIKPSEIRRFWTMLAHNQGQVWNAQAMASNFSLSSPTASNYLGAFEQLFLVRRLEPWHRNVKKRLVKAPLIYLRDSGLLHSLLGIESRLQLLSHPIVGKSWEGWIMEQVLNHSQKKLEGAFYRSHTGAEIDLILHRGAKLLAAVEIKLGLNIKLSRGFYSAHQDLDKPPTWVLSNSKTTYPLEEGITVTNLNHFLRGVLPALAER